MRRILFAAFFLAPMIVSATSFPYISIQNPSTGKPDFVTPVVTSTTLPSGSTFYIQNTSLLQSGSTFYVSSGTVQGQLSVQSLLWPDGSVQVSSPTPSISLWQELNPLSATYAYLQPLNADRLVIDPAGTLTDDTTSALQVNGDIYSSNGDLTTPSTAFNLTSTAPEAGSVQGGLVAFNPNSSDYWLFQMVYSTYGGDNGMVFTANSADVGPTHIADGDVTFKATDTPVMVMRAYNGSPRMLVNGPSDDTTTPLQVNGNTTISGQVAIGNTNLNSDSNHMLSVANSDRPTTFNVGQDSTHNMEFGWNWESDPSTAFGYVHTWGFNNPFAFDASTVDLQAYSSGSVLVGSHNDDGTGSRMQTPNLSINGGASGLTSNGSALQVNGLATSSGYSVNGNDYPSTGQSTEINYNGIAGDIYAFDRDNVIEKPFAFGANGQVYILPSVYYGGTGNVIINAAVNGGAADTVDNGANLQVWGTTLLDPTGSVLWDGTSALQVNGPSYATNTLGGGGTATYSYFNRSDSVGSGLITQLNYGGGSQVTAALAIDDDTLWTTLTGLSSTMEAAGAFTDGTNIVLLGDYGNNFAINATGPTSLDSGAITTNGSGGLTVNLSTGANPGTPVVLCTGASGEFCICGSCS